MTAIDRERGSLPAIVGGLAPTMLLAEGCEREQAMEYLDRACELFSRHGANLYLDQVLAKKEILRA